MRTKRRVTFAESMVSYAASTDSDESVSDGKRAMGKGGRGVAGAEVGSPISQRVSDHEAMDDVEFLENVSKT